MKKEFVILTVVSMLFVFAALAWRGLRLPWSEDGAIYAIYGGSVGFCLAIALSMFLAWKMSKKK